MGIILEGLHLYGCVFKESHPTMGVFLESLQPYEFLKTGPHEPQ